ncbi:MaoC family dehydratase [Rhodococcus opacus]|jgi:acyl dehydratase|uniref:MaoC family dehydratase n=1 Tax=Rhodococcus TaxID=1827 RepID=UPI00146CFC0C|nr:MULTISPECIES: MaoC family dehydratase [Rhodococcus]MDI9937620.1 MaoC family dehydratase [Rhodococcus sp. IEGM 1351]UNM98621.1 MaoC family dehydratase [Rhodococcus opacus]WKN55902.1 MaoC family dehydratase [Rhodococcus opacus]
MSTHLAEPADLLGLIGQTVGITEPYYLTQSQINRFADATGDHQWIHTDVERAAQGPFGGTIAHGYLTLALTPLVLAEVLTIDNVTAALNYGLNRVRFPAPVLAGSPVRATVAVTGAEQKPGGVEAVFGLTFTVDGAERPACIADVVVLYR